MSEVLKRGLASLSIEYSIETLEKFAVYKKLLLEWNEKFNLTAITDEREIDLLHFLDSATILNDTLSSEKIADVGSGAGFPGIPLKILGAHGEVFMFDSLRKRIGFIETVIKELGLNDCHAVHIRAEDAGRGKYREFFDTVAARAVANLAVLSEYCLPLVKTGGTFIAMKGRETGDEIKAYKDAVKKLGGRIRIVKTFNLVETDIERTLIYIDKNAKTPDIYPRKAGTPVKRPL